MSSSESDDLIASLLGDIAEPTNYDYYLGADVPTSSSEELFLLFSPIINKTSTLLFISTYAAREIGYMLQAQWDGCNSITVNNLDRIALINAAALLKSEFCAIGDYCDLEYELPDFVTDPELANTKLIANEKYLDYLRYQLELDRICCKFVGTSIYLITLGILILIIADLKIGILIVIVGSAIVVTAISISLLFRMKCKEKLPNL